MDSARKGLCIAGLVALLCVGCSEIETPADQFNATQAGSLTPHGRVIEGSAENVAPGRVRYRTEQGMFEVDAVPQEGGSYRWANTEQSASERSD